MGTQSTWENKRNRERKKVKKAITQHKEKAF